VDWRTFELLTPISDIETIAVNLSIRELDRLRKEHGHARWRKLKGRVVARSATGQVAEVEVHWYEAHGIGRRDMKVKRVLQW
jgi:hypothetical protein